MRKPQEKIFKKEIDGIGTFVFQHLTIGEELQVENQIAKLLNYNPDPHNNAYFIAKMIATLSVAIKQAPEDWDLDECFDGEEAGRVFSGYMTEVDSFRRSGDGRNQESGPGDVSEPPVLAQAEVQPPRKRSTVSGVDRS